MVLVLSMSAGLRRQPPLGMGGAFVAVADDGAAVYWNPRASSSFRTRRSNSLRRWLKKGLSLPVLLGLHRT